MPKIPSKMNWVSHRDKWRGCELCTLCETRKSVVLARGKIPADILFIGEAPGESEDVLGQPFKGPAGHLLDRIIAASIGGRATHCMTNLIACIPIGDDGAKTLEPSDESILACRGRVEEVHNLVRPRLIVCVGRLSRKWLDRVIPHREAKAIDLIHPAAILRGDDSQKPLAIQRCVVALSDAIADW